MAEYDICHIKKTTMKAIADSVRAKTGKTALIPGENLPSEIQSIVTTGNAPAGTLKITKNDIYNVTEYAAVDVDVPIPDEYVPEGTVPEGYMPIPTEELQIVDNGPYDVLNFARIIVDVPVNEFVEEWDGSFTIVIIFAVGAVTLQAEKGMTWEEWLTSDYKADDIIADGDNLTVSGAPSGFVIATQDGTAVTLSDKIISGHSYILCTATVASTISFTIGDKSYTADNGDKWSDWIISEYNNDDTTPIVEVGNHVSVSAMQSGYALCTSDGALVRTDDYILADHQYVLTDSTEITASFTIGDMSLTANPGNTWAKWITSEHNDDATPIVEVGNWVSVSTMQSGYALYTSDGVLVKTDDYILVDHQYVLTETSGKVISFEIGDLSLNANIGDIWEDWLTAEYNTASAVKVGNRVNITTLDDALVFTSGGLPVSTDEYILADHQYVATDPEDVTEIITFTVDGTSYDALPGDNWAYWITTSNNVYGFIINSADNRVMNKASTGYLYTDAGSYVNATDTIVAGHAYTFSTM